MALDQTTLPKLNPYAAGVVAPAAAKDKATSNLPQMSNYATSTGSVESPGGLLGPSPADVAAMKSAPSTQLGLTGTFGLMGQPSFGGGSTSLWTGATPVEPAPASPVPPLTPAASVATPSSNIPATATATTAPTKQSNWDIANEFAKKQASAGDPTGQVYRTSLALALHGLNAETAAQAQETQAQTGKGQQLLMPHEIAQEQEIDPLTGMATRNRNVYGTYNPATKGWEPIKLPEIAKKTPTKPLTAFSK